MDTLITNFRQEDIRVFEDGDEEWLDLGRVCSLYRKHVRGATQFKLVKEFKLIHRVVMRRGKNIGKVLNLVLVDAENKQNPLFNLWTMAVYVKLDDIFKISELRSVLFKVQKVNPRQRFHQRNVVPNPEPTSMVDQVDQELSFNFCELNNASLSQLLNLRLCGLYFVDLGLVSNLRKTLPIDEKMYPPNVYDSSRIGKLGCSENFRHRFNDIKAQYGEFSSTFTFRWFLMVPYDKLILAESRLKGLVLAHRMKLHFRKYREFTIYKPSNERTLRTIYYRVGNEFPVVEHDMQLKDVDLLSEAKLAKERKEHWKTILEHSETHTKDVQKIHELEIQLLQKDLEIMQLRHRK